ncbi:MAG: glycerophosphodiester phosphodiesterase [Verrucomicrobiaceae bacterium]|nr:glycerophosphodiester phosphodiesterase [Verrucomicrobiaceae bacterium]
MKTLLFLLLAMNAAAVEIIAHRGFSAKAPENTIEAFELAWKSGADACELDIHLTADGEVVVIHDKDTKRTFPGENKVIAQTKLAELSDLPTLTEALATMPADRGRFVIEIKTGAEIVPALVKVLVKVLEPLKPRAKQIAIISFQREACIAAKKALPWIPVLQLSGSKDKKTKQPIDLTEVIAKAKADGLDGLDLGADWAWSEAMVAQIHAAGLTAVVYTINKPADVARYAKLGLDGITTDDPVMAKKALE